MNEYEYTQNGNVWTVTRPDGSVLGQVTEGEVYYVANGKRHLFMCDAIETLEGVAA